MQDGWCGLGRGIEKPDEGDGLMKRVALMTWFQYHNYGTALQAVALSRVISSLGFEVDVVDYRTSGKVITAPEGSMLMWLAKEACGRIRGRLRQRAFSSAERECLFDSFLRDDLAFTDPCGTMDDLEALNDEYDAFVCGSDQIWLPSAFDPHYFLDFASSDSLKVAYAPSLGLSEVRNGDVVRRMGGLASRIDCLSTREETGSAIISGLTGREVSTVLDPTLLIGVGKWRTLSEKSRLSEKRPYLLAYMLGRNEQQWRMVRDMALRLGLPIRVIPVLERDRRREGCIEEPIGPLEFLSLVANASYVCTDSFHGVAFSLVFEREFCVFERFRKGDPRSQNSRIYSILEKMGLKVRLAADGAGIESLVEPIDWAAPRERLASERAASLSWLGSALATEPKARGRKANVLQSRTLCCGCSACESVCPAGAIGIVLDEEGFWHVRVDEDVCVSCGRCRSVCPFIERSHEVRIEKGRLYSYKSDDSSRLLTSSSGGAAAAIAEGASAGGASVLGCVFDAKQHGAVHRLAMPGDSDALASFSGSKYLQSNMSIALGQAGPFKGSLVVFGTPCQIAGARNLFTGRDDVLYVDLVCHGVPTRHLYMRYLDWLCRKHGLDPGHTRTEFRYKPKGWRTIYLHSTDGEREACVRQRRDPFFLLFEFGLCYARCCYECPWRSASAADVRLGDYWGPRFKWDKTGVSMALAMTEQGRGAVEVLADAGGLRPQPLDDYLRWQQTENHPEPVFRDRLVRTLADPDVRLEDAVDEFVEPMARRRDVARALSPLVRVVKGLLTCGKSKER